jgi:hypothetical protein
VRKSAFRHNARLFLLQAGLIVGLTAFGFARLLSGFMATIELR